MEKDRINEELQTRREFFKKVSKRILPMLGVFVAGPTVMMSTLTSCGCDGCEAACQDDCNSSCSGSCNTSCFGTCNETSSSSTCSDCSSSCSGSSTSNTCSSCANDCSTSCKDTCQTSCSNTCSTSCEGSATGKQTTGSIDGHEYVDLGLSVLWATCNIGATNQEEFGDYYAFADPSGLNVVANISSENESNMEYYKSLNLEAGLSISGTYLDVARNKWGNKWKLPTIDECQELIDNCSLEYYAYDNGLKSAIKFVSKKNGSNIMFPIAGYIYRKGDEPTDYACETGGHYWTGIYLKKNSNNKSATSFRAAQLIVGAFGVKSARVTKDTGDSSDGVPVATLSSIRPIAKRDNGNVSTCNGTCTANCSSDCSLTCKNECSGTCKGSCGNDCTGGCKEGCSTGCKTTCKGECSTACTGTCTGTCSGTCSGGCSSSCTGGCKGTCSGTCGSGCSGGCSSCTATCADSCKAQTSQGCSNCATQCSGDCNHECTYGCGRQCYTSCGGNCKGKCGGNCQVECTYYAKNTACSSCGGTCSSACNESCTYDCYSTCKSIGYK